MRTQGRLTRVEDREQGQVKAGVYLTYARAFGKQLMALLALSYCFEHTSR